MKIPDSGERVRVAQADDRLEVDSGGRSLSPSRPKPPRLDGAEEGSAAVRAMPVGQGHCRAGVHLGAGHLGEIFKEGQDSMEKELIHGGAVATLKV